MLDLALHIIKKKAGRFDPTTFDDRYDAALVELVKAQMEGRNITPPKAPEPTKPTDLMEALRQSAREGQQGSPREAQVRTQKDGQLEKRRSAAKPPRRAAVYASGWAPGEAPPDGRSVPAESRNYARKTSGPTAPGEPAARLVGISLSTTQGTPSFLTPPSGLGISTRLTGCGW